MDLVSELAPRHGGNLQAASRQFGIAPEDWNDLSTGISPWSWPVPAIPERVFRRLPPEADALERQAADFYGVEQALLAVPGSQWAIAAIPECLARRGEICAGDRVALPRWGYQEHRAAWLRAGAVAVDYENLDELFEILGAGGARHVVVIDPNNPTTERAGEERLRSVAEFVAPKGGWLVVDQAFAEVRGAKLPALGERCVVLRSLGKFFGLAGLRVGFVRAPSELEEALCEALGPWALSHPAHWIAKAALADRAWQAMQRERIARQSQRWARWLGRRFELEFSNAGLFVTGRGDARACERIYLELARRGVLVRIFSAFGGENLLRFGLPLEMDEEMWGRFWPKGG